MKACTYCNEVKDLSLFIKDSSKKDGRRAVCKKCYSIRKVAYNKIYRDKLLTERGGNYEQLKKAESLGVSVDILLVCRSTAQQVNIEQQKKKIIEANNKRFLNQIAFENSVMVSSKQCYKCGEVKSVTEFYPTTYRRDGYGGLCKKCERIKSLTYINSDGCKQYRMTKTYKDRKKENSKKYNSDPKNKERISLNSRVQNYKRRMRIKQDGGHITAKELRELKSTSNSKCYWCNKKIAKGDLRYDHYIPLSKGGSNTIDNMVIAHSSCNGSKHNKMPEVFANTLGRLL